jgi:lipopolysaccharide/colanic/teichoic acid biosynthesis glycosyltransferase
MKNNYFKDIAKRLFDLIIVSIFLILISPLLFLLFILAGLERLLFLDPGPPFVSEPRISKGMVFKMFKLNLYKEKNRREYIKTSDDFKEHGTYAYLQMQSQSLTMIGKLMKKYYLDELGQLFNVMNGDMSLVGARPLPVGYESNSLPPRQEMKAGIVGFSATRWKNGKKVVPKEADMEYLNIYNNDSILELLKVDILILFAALRAIGKGKGL